MATLSNNHGRRFIQFPTGSGRKKRTLSLGRMSDRAAQVIKGHVEHLVTARSSGSAVPPPTAAWLTSIGDSLHTKVAEVGLAEPRAGGAGLAAFLEGYITGRTDLKPRSITNLDQARKSLVKFFGPTRDIASITRGEAGDWHRSMKLRLARATVSTHVKKARQFFADALDRKLVADNPFKAVKAGSQRNESRMQYVPASDVLRVIDRCPDAEWRLLFALARHAGLRVPSETRLLKWSDVDFDRERMTVHSPKTEHHEGQGSRQVPIFADLRPYLQDVFDAAEPGSVYVLSHLRNVSLRTQAEKLIRRAGLPVWPKLFQQLRSSCETDLTAHYPLHVACAWVGNSEAVAKKHYLMVTEDHFAAAAKGALGGSGSVSAAPGAARAAKGCLTNPEHVGVNRSENPGEYEIQYPQGRADLSPELAETLRVSERFMSSALRRLQVALPFIRQFEIDKLSRQVEAAFRGGAA